MYVVFSEAEFAELNAKAFKVPERLDTGVDVAFFSEVPVSFVCWKHHGHPVIAGVIRNLLELSLHTTLIILYFSCRVREGAGECLPHATKRRYGLSGEKRDATFHLMAVELFFWKKILKCLLPL
jgi:hypothetical protein